MPKFWSCVESKYQKERLPMRTYESLDHDVPPTDDLVRCEFSFELLEATTTGAMGRGESGPGEYCGEEEGSL